MHTTPTTTHQPLLIALGGPTGAGKTTLAYKMKREIAALHDCMVLDNDQVRRDLFGYDLRAIMKPEHYTPEATQRVRDRLDALTCDAFAQGKDVIDSSGFWSPESRQHIAALASACGAAFIGIWLNVPRAELVSRITQRLYERATLPELKGERGHASDACTGVLDKYAHLPSPSAGEGWFTCEAGGDENSSLSRVKAFLN